VSPAMKPVNKGGPQIILALLLCGGAFLIGRYRTQHHSEPSSVINIRPMAVLKSRVNQDFSLDYAGTSWDKPYAGMSFQIRLRRGSSAYEGLEHLRSKNVNYNSLDPWDFGLHATIECLDNTGKPLGPPGALKLDGANGIAGLIDTWAPSDYPRETRSLRLSVYSDSDPARQSMWNFACPTPPMDVAAVPPRERVSAGKATLEIEAVEVLENSGRRQSPSIEAGGEITAAGLARVFRPPNTLLPCVVGVIRITDPTDNAATGGTRDTDWQLHIDNLELNGVANDAPVQLMPIAGGPPGSHSAYWVFLAGAVYPGLTQRLRVAVQVARRTSKVNSKMLEEHKVVFNVPLRNRFEPGWLPAARIAGAYATMQRMDDPVSGGAGVNGSIRVSPPQPPSTRGVPASSLTPR